MSGKWKATPGKLVNDSVKDPAAASTEAAQCSNVTTPGGDSASGNGRVAAVGVVLEDEVVAVDEVVVGLVVGIVTRNVIIVTRWATLQKIAGQKSESRMRQPPPR